MNHFSNTDDFESVFRAFDASMEVLARQAEEITRQTDYGYQASNQYI